MDILASIYGRMLMCGLAGQVAPGVDGAVRGNVVRQMLDTLSHRGPDDAGLWNDTVLPVTLGHRRLEIVGLGPEGHQPMASACGRFVISYNGEVYNHAEVRETLRSRGHTFRGHADTEVLLGAIAEWGFPAALERCVGMFAFALVDRVAETVVLVRDRLGEKPLYYGRIGGFFSFASELRAFRVLPNWEGSVDREALAAFLQFSYVPGPRTIFQGVSKLSPGSFVTIQLGSGSPILRGPTQYWSAERVARGGREAFFEGDDRTAVAALERHLIRAITPCMMADVPLGAFLSGGVDSTTVVALMQAYGSRPTKTFTVGFHEAGYDEAPAARAVARHLGTNHHELYVSAADAMAVLPKVAAVYDEPFADASQLPTLLVARLAGQHVKVALTGDGGDELFGGYARHVWMQRWGRHVRHLPLQARRAAASMLQALSPDRWDLLLHRLGRYGVIPRAHASPGEKLHKLARLLGQPNPVQWHEAVASRWQGASGLLVGDVRASPPWNRVPLDTMLATMLLQDQRTYLPDDILVKVDRAAMSTSLESRAPFLDHRVVAFAWSLPDRLKVRSGQGKWILRQVAGRYVPSTLLNRPKAGFTVPIRRWLRNGLRTWAEALLDETRLRRDGFFEAAAVQALWQKHVKGEDSGQDVLWNILMFQEWYEHQSAMTPPAAATTD